MEAPYFYRISLSAKTRRLAIREIKGHIPPMEMRRRELLVAAGLYLVLPPTALAEPAGARRLDLKNANTGETFNGPYRDKDGPIPNAMIDLAIFLRDHHVNKLGPVHVETLDFLSDVMAAVGETKATILSAYRTPETNRKLRERYFGVAEKSQHLAGRALDVTFDGKVLKAEQAALAMQRGGVGWYPDSHFIHIDTGPVRHWEIDGTGIDNFLVGPPPRRILTYRELMRRYHAYARREFMLRQRGK
ncbi:MAG: YcbK family protein [Stellaceae bacterium]